MQFRRIGQNLLQEGFQTDQLVDGDSHPEDMIEPLLEAVTYGGEIRSDDLMVVFLKGTNIHIEKEEL